VVLHLAKLVGVIAADHELLGSAFELYHKPSAEIGVRRGNGVGGNKDATIA
jgi:hypothetical protein